MRLVPAPKVVVKVVVMVDEVADEVAVDTVVVVDDATSKCHLCKRRQDKT
jgi:hypothetical protein